MLHWCPTSPDTRNSVQPVQALAQMVVELATMHQEQVAIHHKQVGILQAQAEQHSQVLEKLVAQPWERWMTPSHFWICPRPCQWCVRGWQ